MNPTGRRGRTFALIEVALAFALMHVAFRAFKGFTTWGQQEVAAGLNYSPGLALIVVSLAFIAVRRRRLDEYGLTTRPFLSGVNTALFSILVMALVAGSGMALGLGYRPHVASSQDALVFVGAHLVVTLAILWGLRRFDDSLLRCPRALTLVMLAGIPAVPLLAPLVTARPFLENLLTVGWVIIGAGIGEEVFFRGYVQSRLNGAFGRPWRLFGVPFGVGLVVASLLFGLVHALNTVDYFGDVYRFNGWHGSATATTLFYGFLREKTGSVLAPGVVHGFVDLLARMPQLLGYAC